MEHRVYLEESYMDEQEPIIELKHKDYKAETRYSAFIKSFGDILRYLADYYEGRLEYVDEICMSNDMETVSFKFKTFEEKAPCVVTLTLGEIGHN